MRSGWNVNGAGSEAIKTQRQDVVLAPAHGHAIQMPAAAVIRDLEAEERGRLRLSEDTDSSQDGLLSILSVAARVVCVECKKKVNTRDVLAWEK